MFFLSPHALKMSSPSAKSLFLLLPMSPVQSVTHVAGLNLGFWLPRFAVPPKKMLKHFATSDRATPTLAGSRVA